MYQSFVPFSLCHIPRPPEKKADSELPDTRVTSKQKLASDCSRIWFRASCLSESDIHLTRQSLVLGRQQVLAVTVAMALQGAMVHKQIYGISVLY